MSKNYMADTLGKTLKALREKKGLTLMEAAQSLSIDYSMLAKIEKDQRNVNEGLFARIAKLFDVKEEDLRTLLLADKLYKQSKNHSFAVKALKIATQRVIEEETKA